MLGLTVLCIYILMVVDRTEGFLKPNVNSRGSYKRKMDIKASLPLDDSLMHSVNSMSNVMFPLSYQFTFETSSLDSIRETFTVIAKNWATYAIVLALFVILDSDQSISELTKDIENNEKEIANIEAKTQALDITPKDLIENEKELESNKVRLEKQLDKISTARSEYNALREANDKAFAEATITVNNLEADLNDMEVNIEALTKAKIKAADAEMAELKSQKLSLQIQSATVAAALKDFLIKMGYLEDTEVKAFYKDGLPAIIDKVAKRGVIKAESQEVTKTLKDIEITTNKVKEIQGEIVKLEKDMSISIDKYSNIEKAIQNIAPRINQLPKVKARSEESAQQLESLLADEGILIDEDQEKYFQQLEEENEELLSRLKSIDDKIQELENSMNKKIESAEQIQSELERQIKKKSQSTPTPILAKSASTKTTTNTTKETTTKATKETTTKATKKVAVASAASTSLTVMSIDKATDSITLTNKSGSDQSMGGMVLVDNSETARNTYTFPDGYTLKKGASVTVYCCPDKFPASGSGESLEWITKSGTLRKSKFFTKVVSKILLKDGSSIISEFDL